MDSTSDLEEEGLRSVGEGGVRLVRDKMTNISGFWFLTLSKFSPSIHSTLPLLRDSGLMSSTLAKLTNTIHIRDFVDNILPNRNRLDIVNWVEIHTDINIFPEDDYAKWLLAFGETPYT